MLQIVKYLRMYNNKLRDELRKNQSLGKVDDELREILNKIESLDKIAARCIILGLMAYGWTVAELLCSESPLIHEVKKYVNIYELLNKLPLKRQSGSDGDTGHPKRQRTACYTSNTNRDKTGEDQRPRGRSPSTAESTSSREATVCSGSEQTIIGDGSAVSTPDDAALFESDSTVGLQPSVGMNALALIAPPAKSKSGVETPANWLGTNEEGVNGRGSSVDRSWPETELPMDLSWDVTFNTTSPGGKAHALLAAARTVTANKMTRRLGGRRYRCGRSR